MTNEEKAYRIWLHNCIKLALNERQNLLYKYKSYKDIFNASFDDHMAAGILSKDKIKHLMEEKEKADPIKTYQEYTEKGIDYICINDPNYPANLKEIPDPPFGFYIKGKPIPKDNINVAIVGARRCSSYGAQAAEKIAATLARNNITVVSGMARGIDSASHVGALGQGGFTIAVLGCGVDVCYPAENKALYDEITRNGCIISEYAPGTQPQALYFPIRNRIISGLCHHVIVVEARKKSGSLITAELAIDYNRNVYALPGRITDPLSSGTNHLIHYGAQIITSIDSIINMIAENDYESALKLGDLKSECKEEIMAPRLAADEKRIYSTIDYYPTHFDTIEEKSHKERTEIITILSSLIAKKIIRETFPGFYARV